MKRSMLYVHHYAEYAIDWPPNKSDLSPDLIHICASLRHSVTHEILVLTGRLWTDDDLPTKQVLSDATWVIE